MIANYAKVFSHSKKTVNGRRINKETMRVKLLSASFVDRPRLVKKVARKS